MMNKSQYSFQTLSKWSVYRGIFSFFQGGYWCNLKPKITEITTSEVNLSTGCLQNAGIKQLVLMSVHMYKRNFSATGRNSGGTI